MKIAFIVGGLESGADGVGDYARSLAQELARHGHRCVLIALHDAFVHETTRTSLNADAEIEILRLPRELSWAERVARASEFLDEFAPDWVSLQFVCYGFHQKGIVHNLATQLFPLLAKRRVHVMFHELWVGEHATAPLKERITGIVQKYFIAQLIRRIKPQVLHTSNQRYLERLERCGMRASLLPMFGAIPVGEQTGDAWLLPRLREAGLNITTENREAFWLFGFFGALHPVWPPEPLCKYLQQAAEKQQRRIAWLSIGRMGPGEALWQALADRYGAQFVFLKLGAQPVDKISQFFNSLDFGVSASPLSIIGKSSSAAAMLEHGLPVIINRNDLPLLEKVVPLNRYERLLLPMDHHLPDKLVAVPPRQILGSRLPDVAAQFVHDLAMASPRTG